MQMEKAQLARYDLPDVPGVYLFKQGRKVLYVGKATSLRDRVRSYFDNDLIATRGPRLVDMITKADRISHEATPTVLEALVREAALIRKYNPPANSDGKDDKTFLYALITDEEIPRVLAERGSNIDFEHKEFEEQKLKAIYGPFPSGPQLREGLRLIRRIFPFFDTAKPIGYKGKHQRARVEFNTQIGQYPREIDRKSYLRSIRHVALFLSGKTKELRVLLNREMKAAAQEERFEDAAEARRQLFALDHIQDVSLIKDENLQGLRAEQGLRIEGFDTAHISGTNAIGVMTVVVDGVPVKKEYRSFLIRGIKNPKTGKAGRAGNDDIGSLKEILSRRLGHPEWQLPRAIVVDGGKVQKKAAESVLSAAGIAIPVAAVVKDEKHRPREVLGALRQLAERGITTADAVLVNSEAHRFSLRLHRLARRRASNL
jgi:excinuclease ABC subunit C